MSNRTHALLASICATLPAHARLIDADAYRHADFGAAMAGVQLEFDTGHLHLVTIPAEAADCLHTIGADIAARVIALMAARRIEEVHVN